MYYSQKVLKRIGLELSGIVPILCQQPRGAEGGERYGKSDKKTDMKIKRGRGGVIKSLNYVVSMFQNFIFKFILNLMQNMLLNQITHFYKFLADCM